VRPGARLQGAGLGRSPAARDPQQEPVGRHIELPHAARLDGPAREPPVRGPRDRARPQAPQRDARGPERLEQPRLLRSGRNADMSQRTGQRRSRRLERIVTHRRASPRPDPASPERTAFRASDQAKGATGQRFSGLLVWGRVVSLGEAATGRARSPSGPYRNAPRDPAPGDGCRCQRVRAGHNRRRGVARPDRSG